MYILCVKIVNTRILVNVKSALKMDLSTNLCV